MILNTQRPKTNLHIINQFKQNAPLNHTLKLYSGWGGLRTELYSPEVHRESQTLAQVLGIVRQTSLINLTNFLAMIDLKIKSLQMAQQELTRKCSDLIHLAPSQNDIRYPRTTINFLNLRKDIL